MAVLSNLDLLRRVPVFSELSSAQMEQLADKVTKQRVKRGDVIVEKGKNSRALFIILSGRARVLLADQRGKEVILDVLGPGDYIGEISLLDNKSHSATVQTEVQCDLLVLGQEDFNQCLDNNHAMARSIIKGLVQRLRNADEKIGSLALMDVYGRVAKALVSMSEPTGHRILEIKAKTTRQDIAKMVGASREMVSRVMRDFEEQGFIKTCEDGSVTIQERRGSAR
jgi:CRP-like cAMP-binding protein